MILNGTAEKPCSCNEFTWAWCAAHKPFLCLPSRPNWWSLTAHEWNTASGEQAQVSPSKPVAPSHLSKKQVTLACVNPLEVSKPLWCLLVVLCFLICCHLGPDHAPGGQRLRGLSAGWCMCCWVLAEGRGALRGGFEVELNPAALVQHTVYMVQAAIDTDRRWHIVNQNYCLNREWEEKNTSKDSRWHLEFWSEWTQVLIRSNGRILILNTRSSSCKGLLSSKPFSLCLNRSILRYLWELLWFLHHVPVHLEPGSRRELSLMHPLSLCFCPSVWQEYEISLVTTFLRNETREIHLPLCQACLCTSSDRRTSASPASNLWCGGTNLLGRLRAPISHAQMQEVAQGSWGTQPVIISGDWTKHLSL